MENGVMMEKKQVNRFGLEKSGTSDFILDIQNWNEWNGT